MILKISPFWAQKYSNKMLPSKKVTSNHVDNREMGNIPYYQPTFGCSKGVKLIEKLSTIENLHCPICGVSLLTKEKFIELANGKYKTVEDISQMLRKNKRYIQNNLRALISLFEELTNENPQMSAIDSINNIREKMARKKSFWLKGIQQDVINTKNIENVGSSNINSIIENYRKKTIPYDKCKLMLLSIFENQTDPEINDLHLKIKKLLKEILVCEYTLSVKNAHEMPDDLKIKTFIEKLFKNSLAEKNELVSKADNIENIEFLECSSCAVSKTMQHTIKNYDTSIEKNIMQYFNDIYKSNIYDATFSKYILNFINLIRFFSKYKINPMHAKSDKFKEIKAEIFRLESPSIGFVLSGISGIPCASCGTITLTHQEKDALNLEIKKTKNLFELQELLNNKSIHLKDTYRVIVDRYNKILEEDPNISDSDMILLLRNITIEKLSEHTNKSINYAKELLLKETTSQHDKQIYENYIKIAQEELINYDRFFYPVRRFYEIFDNTLANIEDVKEKHEFYKIKQLLYDEFKRQFTIFPPHKIKTTNKSDLKDTISFLFTRASSTVDHIHAKSKDGENDENNYMILCKDCNQAKKNFDFIHWIRKNESINIKYYLQKYVYAVSEKIKDLKIKSYKDYPINFIKQIRKETNHTVTLKLPKDE